jgi:ABC-type multidrug transport system fused ATPase/permease subunit
MRKYFSLTLRLWKLLKDFHRDFYLQLASTVVQQLIGIGIVLIAAKMLDALVTKNTHLIPWFIGLYFLANIVRNRIGYYADMQSLKKIDNAIQQFLEEYSFRKIFKLNVSQYAEGHSAIKLQVINRGENAVESIVSNVVLTLLPAATQIIFSIIAISFYSKTLALWSSLTLFIVLFWSNKFANFHRPFIRKNTDSWDLQRKVRAEAFQHLTLIKVSAAETSYLKKYLEKRLSILDYSIFTWGMNIKHGYRRGLFMIVSRIISTCIMFYLAIKGLITVGAVYAIWSWLNDAYNTIQSLIQNIRQLPLRFIELEKYLEIIDTEALFDESGKRNVQLASSIEVSHLSFSYPQGVTSVFDDISFTIPEKKITAFVGASGSGKSTIVKLLLRAYDYKNGSIKIGDEELKKIDGNYLRERIGYVEQHVDMFDDTLKENILLGVKGKEKKDAEERLEDIAKKARIDQFYHRLGETKFETIVGERGIKLSGGERQRIGIARAIIKNPEILIFDEATSSLDTENEKYVMDAIKDVSKGKTTIIIAHRLSTVRDADKIIVMDKGKVVGEGTHDELLATNATYQNLVAHQV